MSGMAGFHWAFIRELQEMALSFIWLIQFSVADLLYFEISLLVGKSRKTFFSYLYWIPWNELSIFYYGRAKEIKHQPAAEQNFLFTTPPIHRFSWLCHGIRLLHFHSAVKIRPFSPVFLLAESTAKAFCRLILFDFKEKSINHFLRHNHFL